MTKFITALIAAIIMAATPAAAKDAETVADSEYLISPETTNANMALIEFTPNASGLYSSALGKPVDYAVYIRSRDIYAYCPKSALFFYITPTGNYRATATKEFNKLLKKDKRLMHMNLEDTSWPAENMTEILKAKYADLNRRRQAEINDSLAVERARKARADSLAAVEQAAEMRRREIEAYRNEHRHDWRLLPLDERFRTTYCRLCTESHTLDTMCLAGMSDKEWLYVTPDQIHLIDAPVVELPAAETYGTEWHLEAFADSMAELKHASEQLGLFDIDILSDMHRLKRMEQERQFKADIRKIMPFGAIEDYDWDNEYGMVTFDVTYLNTNEKTIKYIDFWFAIKNDVNDVRCKGHFKGTGPVEPWASGRWVWDTSAYWASGDASRMQITKIVITYMNGTQKVLTGKAIQYWPKGAAGGA